MNIRRIKKQLRKVSVANVIIIGKDNNIWLVDELAFNKSGITAVVSGIPYLYMPYKDIKRVVVNN